MSEKNMSLAQTIVNLHDNERASFASLARAFGISRERVRQIYNAEKHPAPIKPERIEPVYNPDDICNICGEPYEVHDPKSFVLRRESQNV
jgi:hypothetical protein